MKSSLQQILALVPSNALVSFHTAIGCVTGNWSPVDNSDAVLVERASVQGGSTQNFDRMYLLGSQVIAVTYASPPQPLTEEEKAEAARKERMRKSRSRPNPSSWTM